MNKIKKLAVLRDDQNAKCPFGLPIPLGCQNIGNFILELPLANNKDDEQNNQIIENNNKILSQITQNEPNKCYFAKKILKNHVVCDLDQEEIDGGLMPVGSPLYFKPLSGSSFFGTYMNPAGYYNDNSIDRSYQTLYSIENIAKLDEQEIIKFANNFISLVKAI